jgi:predicted metal-dependent hydrolase
VQFEWLFGPKPNSVPDESWLQVGAQQVRLRFARHRRARRYVLRLRPDGVARVTIPRGGSNVEARKFAERNVSWLESQILRQASRPPIPQTWSLGTEILFRGERVRLLPLVPHAAPSPLHLQAGRGEATPPPPFSHPIGEVQVESFRIPQLCSVSLGSEILSVEDLTGDLRPAVERHLRGLAAKELPPRVFELARLDGLSVQRVTVRNQRSRWGSCSRRGTISLNWRLIQTPPFVRDYILLHELAHLREMNHSRRFWAEVARLCPDFAQAERWLKDNGDLLR